MTQIFHLGVDFCNFYVKIRDTFFRFLQLNFLDFIKWKLGPK